MTKNIPNTKVAAAIEYDSEKNPAPKVTAKGRGVVAEKIIKLAKKHGVPVKEDPVLAGLLSKLDIDEQIPPELYRAVAEILAFVYLLNEKYREKPE
jgi:flagellar biosynthesis protein